MMKETNVLIKHFQNALSLSEVIASPNAYSSPIFVFQKTKTETGGKSENTVVPDICSSSFRCTLGGLLAIVSFLIQVLGLMGRVPLLWFNLKKQQHTIFLSLLVSAAMSYRSPFQSKPQHVVHFAFIFLPRLQLPHPAMLAFYVSWHTVVAPANFCSPSLNLPHISGCQRG